MRGPESVPRAGRARRPAVAPVAAGTGRGAQDATANLEVMACAVNYNRYLLELLRRFVRPGDRLLDFGAGSGMFAGTMQREGFDVAAVEPDPAQQGAIRALGVPCTSSVDDLPIASFDLVYTFNVLEHIDDDLAALRALYARTRSGGRLFCYVPALPFLYSSMDRRVGHVRRYTAPSLRSVLSAAGYRVERCAYADSLGVLATVAYKWFGSREGSISERGLVAYDRLVFPVSRTLDHVFGRIGGKNLWAMASRAEDSR